MSRPCKRRRICAEPACGQFGPQNGGDRPAVTMTLDEFETIRLIDLEGRTQEQTAAQMDVARTTVQAIYSSARQKLADCLVHEKALIIRGGEYVLCDGSIRSACGCDCHCAAAAAKKEETSVMKIAVTYENGQIFQHFGHTEQFKLYDVADGTVLGARVVDTNGSGHGALAGFLAEHGVDTLICGGIGGGARQALANAGIRLYGGVTGNADQAVAALLQGELAYQADIQCDHHEHRESGCGHHTCG